jgi:membrane-bound lytic murein transglycosylase D
LEQAGLPKELALIPLIESGFQASALSKVGARGYWQIMPGTLRLYTKTSKKRLADLNFSTQIAILIFQDSYEALGTWPLAINAYHSGIGRLRRATQELGTQDICPIVHKYQGKGYKFASRNYYAQFLAAKRLYGSVDIHKMDQTIPEAPNKSQLKKDADKKKLEKYKKNKKRKHLKNH